VKIIYYRRNHVFKKPKLTDLMPKTGKNLIAYSGKEVIEKVG